MVQNYVMAKEAKEALNLLAGYEGARKDHSGRNRSDAGLTERKVSGGVPRGYHGNSGKTGFWNR